MAGYAAVVSLKQTIERILESSRILLVPSSTETVQLAHRELEPLREILERLDRSSISKSRKKLNALDREIKEAVWEFEDSLESLLSHQILSHERDLLTLFSINLQNLRPNVDSFIHTVKDIKSKYIYALHNMPLLEEDELMCSSRNGFGGNRPKMVGFHYHFTNAKDALAGKGSYNYVYSFVGMPGSGKTTLAEKIFEDQDILRCFEHRVWVTVRRKSQSNEIAQRILAQLDPNIKEGDENLKSKLKERLEGKRCLVVLDNVWDTDVLDYFTDFLPEKNNAVIRILLTTNLHDVAEHLRGRVDSTCLTHPMRPMKDEESVELLRQEVFGDKDFPHQLEKAAKKIARKCGGLPLMIVTVADLLSKANKNDDPEFWKEVAENRDSDVMMNAHDQISKVLFPVYDCLPQHLKMLYLYMGAFPQDYGIPASKLMNMLAAEGFLGLQTLEKEFNAGLGNYGTMSNIVISKQKSVDFSSVKNSRLHPYWCYLFKGEAFKDKFLDVLLSPFDAFEEGIEGQRRLCLQSNFLFCFGEVYDSVKRDCSPTLRSLICSGPYHQYSMPIDVGFKLLRVLDALKVRFYSFPLEILELVLLQYLALTYNGELPTSIPKLFNLEFLIIHPHMSIKYRGVSSYVPVQIWDMQELKHIEIFGSNLPNNPNSAASLQKLSTLLGVSAESCTREVLKKLPNIRKLGIRVELTPYDDGSNPFSCFDHISELENLEKLKFSVVNPEVKCGFVPPMNPLIKFPSTLRELCLCGLGYPWGYMSVIGSLPNLAVLKLRCYAFQGPKWRIKRDSFLRVEYLSIEDTDLVKWKPGVGSFPKLRKLRMKHCYKLRELELPSSGLIVGRIEVLDCNPLVVTCAKQLKQRYKYERLLEVFAAFDEPNLEMDGDYRDV